MFLHILCQFEQRNMAVKGKGNLGVPGIVNILMGY